MTANNEYSARDRAIVRLIRAHPANEAVIGAEGFADGTFRLRAAFRLGLPLAWLADGTSPNGVRATEEVTMTFPSAYPLKAPKIELRQDFDRSLAHVQPGPTTQPPEPCVYAGNLAEILQQGGLPTILNQIVSWLEDAAMDKLIKQVQGWEPVRRDSLDNVVVADAGVLRSLVGRKAGHAAFRFDFLHTHGTGSDGRTAFLGQLGTEATPISTSTLTKLIHEGRRSGQLSNGTSLGIVVWPGHQPNGSPFVSDRYRPETVTDWASLRVRATEYGCDGPLDAMMRWLGKNLSELSYQGMLIFAEN